LPPLLEAARLADPAWGNAGTLYRITQNGLAPPQNGLARPSQQPGFVKGRRKFATPLATSIARKKNRGREKDKLRYDKGGGKEKAKLLYAENKEDRKKKRNTPAEKGKKKHCDHERRKKQRKEAGQNAARTMLEKKEPQSNQLPGCSPDNNRTPERRHSRRHTVHIHARPVG
jgi:hypothetical protein